MCGVVGALAYGDFETNKEEKIRQESIIFLTSELLQLNQSRGKDATGIATMFANCDYMGLKMGISAQEFVARFGGKETDYDGYLDVWRKKKHPAKMVIGHCRKPSASGKASALDNKNNHPIKVGDTIGVHNGTLTNHENIFNNLECGRDGKVDSEAVFRLLDHFTSKGTEPFTKEAILETCKRMSGTYACLAFNGNNPYQMAAFRDGRPLHACIIRPLKTLLISSDDDFLKAVVFRYNKMANLYHTGATKFTALKKDDVDLSILKDDQLYIFDITKDITPETEIEELYFSEKIPRTEKIWKKDVSKSNNSTNWNNYNKNNNTVKKTEVTTKKPDTKVTSESAGNSSKEDSGNKTESESKGDNKSNNAERVGMAWNKDERKYTSYFKGKDSYDHGNVSIDLEDGEVKDLSNNKIITPAKKSAYNQSADEDSEGSGNKLEETEKPVDNLITNSAEINEINIEEPKKSEDTTDSSDRSAGTNSDGTESSTLIDHLKKSRCIEVDAATYPDVVEKAQIATKLEQNFSNNSDLANSIEVSNESAMENMALYSLANRIKGFFFNRGWYAGYITRMKEEKGTFAGGDYSRTLLVRARNKASKSKTLIRVMKNTIKVYERVIGKYDDPTKSEKVEQTVTEALEEGKDFKSEALEKIFHKGDLNKSPVLQQIKKTVVAKESN